MPGVYISYPFCGQKCTYCNFASGVMPAALEGQYRTALEREIISHSWNWTPNTLYIGGGSPNRMTADALAHLLALMPGGPWPEATMEAAPGEIAPDLARAWVASGINRVSLGVQSFIDTELRRTGRKHSASTVERDVAMLRDSGLTNINLDLIAGLPGQTPDSWRRSLDWIEKLAPPHVSVYMLEVDEDSRLGLEILNEGQRYGARDIPDDDAIASMYETAVASLASLGIQRYEISNFASPGFESLHNLKYWQLEPYIGFGADAHSLDQNVRWQNCETAAEYVSATDRQRERTAAGTDERFFVGLRLSQGIEPTPAEWQQHAEPIARFERDGLLTRDGNRLRLTPRGVLLSNEVFQAFLD